MLIGLATMLLGMELGTSERVAAVRWATPNLAALLAIIIGSLLDGGARTAMWLLAVAITFGAMVAAGRGEWIIRTGLFAERHALIVIVALGEVIVALGVPVVNALEEVGGVPGSTVVALVASGVFAGLLWWGYFDRPAPALEHRAEQIEGGNARGRFVRDVYTWGHAPFVAGVILSAAALEEIALHPNDPVHVEFRLMLFGGLVLMAVSVTANIWRAFRAVPYERLVALGVAAAMLLPAIDVAGIVLLIVLDLLLLITLVVENQRVEH